MVFESHPYLLEVVVLLPAFLGGFDLKAAAYSEPLRENVPL